MCVPALLRERSGHAYELVNRLRERGFGTTSYGTIYPLVTRLARLGLVTKTSRPSADGPARHELGLTEAGETALNEWEVQWHEVTARVAAVLGSPESSRSNRG
ncbi:PadR family transcriptional regulator [Nocardioides sp. B-3]|uniref:PadR family transcriptional regulator n=1 Tax=Nocardioides sp. B-3 TaxID=2895565 RepID=UPI002153683A|nr:PadR family transcriptional regulator [Nocardioides sp. B-3]UUZ61783.1 PadR family transcriptional regulator [Nocardioides sp. B-3]